MSSTANGSRWRPLTLRRVLRPARMRPERHRRPDDPCPRLVRSQWPRAAVARHGRPLRDPGQRGDAAADAGPPRGPRYTAFVARYPTLRDLAAAPLADVLELWLGLGYNNRAVRLKRCAEFAGDATSRHARRAARLPGSDPYTARAILIFAHNADVAAVDANVRRVLIHELALPPDIDPATLQEVADEALPHGHSRDWHNALMDYGALVLTGRATGIPSPRAETAFAGSRRQKGRLVGGGRGPGALARAAPPLATSTPPRSPPTTCRRRAPRRWRRRPRAGATAARDRCRAPDRC